MKTEFDIHQKRVMREMFIMFGIAGVIVVSLFFVMVFYPDSESVCKLNYSVTHLCIKSDNDADYDEELSQIDLLIEARQSDLPKYSFFDRYKPRKERKALEEKRTEVYELQWQRICLLSEMDDEAELRRSLTKYVRINGCHGEEAELMLAKIGGGR